MGLNMVVRLVNKHAVNGETVRISSGIKSAIVTVGELILKCKIAGIASLTAYHSNIIFHIIKSCR